MTLNITASMCCVLFGILAFSTINAQDSWKTVYTSRYVLHFFKSKNTFEDAKEACERARTTLVKVDDPSITYAINKVIDTSVGYWIGANDIKNEGDWKWLDGSNVNRNEEDGYENW